MQLVERGLIVDAEPAQGQRNSLVGLGVSRVTATSFRVEAGGAWVPDPEGEGEITLSAAVTRGTGALTASTWYFVYLFNNAGVGDVELSATPPDPPYLGGARTKAGDPSRRLVGELRTNPQGNLGRFSQSVGREFVRWTEDQNVTLRAGSGLTSLTGADLDVSPWAPPHAQGVEVSVHLVNSDNPSHLYVTAANDGLMTVGGSEERGQLWTFVNPTGPRQQTSGPIAFAGPTVLRHRQTGGGASRFHHIDVLGYYRRLS